MAHRLIETGRCKVYDSEGDVNTWSSCGASDFLVDLSSFRSVREPR
jgi:hypothetical protein